MLPLSTNYPTSVHISPNYSYFRITNSYPHLNNVLLSLSFHYQHYLICVLLLPPQSSIFTYYQHYPYPCNTYYPYPPITNSIHCSIWHLLSLSTLPLSSNYPTSIHITPNIPVIPIQPLPILSASTWKLVSLSTLPKSPNYPYLPISKTYPYPNKYQLSIILLLPTLPRPNVCPIIPIFQYILILSTSYYS